jgi:6-hydroxynicotinate 3-monooxygenase
MSISPSVGAAIEKNSFNCSQMTFRNSSGALIGRMAFGTKKRYGVEHVFASRQCIHEALLAEIPPHTIVWNKKVIRLQENEEGVRIDFDDFTSEYADLVIGADGVRSVAREAVLGQGYEARYK